MPRAMKVCSQPGCPELTRDGRCPTHRRDADRARGTAAQRGYTGKRWESARTACLTGRCHCTSDCHHGPLCTCTTPGHGHDGRCTALATDADHWPRDRKQLIASGIRNPDAVEHLRSLCGPCHKRETAAHQPGGWHAG